MSADTDLRLCRFLGWSPGYWLRAQAAHDIEVARAVLAEAIERIQPLVISIRPKAHNLKARATGQAMSQQAFERGDWAAVIEAHPLESHDPAEWLRYGAALLHTIEPGPQQGRQQQQAALAFVQAQKEGASAEAVRLAQWAALQRCVRDALRQAVEPLESV